MLFNEQHLEAAARCHCGRCQSATTAADDDHLIGFLICADFSRLNSWRMTRSATIYCNFHIRVRIAVTPFTPQVTVPQWPHWCIVPAMAGDTIANGMVGGMWRIVTREAVALPPPAMCIRQRNATDCVITHIYTTNIFLQKMNIMNFTLRRLKKKSANQKRDQHTIGKKLQKSKGERPKIAPRRTIIPPRLPCFHKY